MNNAITSVFRSLWNRNYRLFFVGQCVSLTGTWIQQMAMIWLVYNLTKSPVLMGLITFVSFIPTFVVSPFAGVLIDRVNQYYLLILLQTIFMIQAFALAILTILGQIHVWHLLVLGALTGITYAIDMPLRQAFVVQLIEDNNDLGNAISLNSFSFNLARLIGPAIAGILIASFGEGFCFLINAISYLAVIFALFAMRINLKPVEVENELKVFKEMKEGFQYSFNSAPIRNIIIFLAVASFIGMTLPVLLPIFAKEILHGGAHTLGFLMSTSGIGAFFGALCLAGKKTVSDLEKWIFIASLFFGFSLIGLAFTNEMRLALVLAFFIGVEIIIVLSACNTLVQNFVHDAKRGRVMSIYTMAFVGTSPIGSLFGGIIANKVGVPYTFALCGLIIVVASLIFSTKIKHFST